MNNKLQTTDKVRVPEIVSKELTTTDNQVDFLRYPDGTLRLFKVGQMLGEIPAGYSDERVVVKIRVRTASQEFAVIVEVTRKSLDLPGAEDRLAQGALTHR